MSADVVAAAAAAGPPRAEPARVPLAGVRRYWRAVHPPPSVLRRLDLAYTGALVVGIVGALAYGTMRSVLSRWVTPDSAAQWGPSLVLVALWVVARWGAIQGPVVFTSADVAHLLQAPLSRRALALPRLVRNLAFAALAGAVLAALALIGLGGQGRGVTVAAVAGLVGGLALCGVLGMALAGVVEGSARWDRLTRLAGLPVVVVAAALVVVADSGATGRAVARWSGPWGWAVQPVIGVAPRHWAPALAALAALTVVVAVAVARRCQRWPSERHELRAAARSGAIASLYALDTRTARRSLTAAAASSAGARPARARGVRRPANPLLAVPWRDLTAALAAPVVVFQAVALTVAGTVLALLAADRPAAGAAGALVVYLGAQRLLEPLRAETDNPARLHVLMPTPTGRVLLLHAAVPGAVVVVSAFLAAVGCAISGDLPAHGGAAALLAVLAAPTITLCAANASRRGGRIPDSVFTSFVGGDPSGGGMIIAWLVAWPLAAAVLGGGPAVLVAHSSSALFVAALVALAVPPILALVVGRPDAPA